MKMVLHVKLMICRKMRLFKKMTSLQQEQRKQREQQQQQKITKNLETDKKIRR